MQGTEAGAKVTEPDIQSLICVCQDSRCSQCYAPSTAARVTVAFQRAKGKHQLCDQEAVLKLEHKAEQDRKDQGRRTARSIDVSWFKAQLLRSGGRCSTLLRQALYLTTLPHSSRYSTFLWQVLDFDAMPEHTRRTRADAYFWHICVLAGA
eukprot:1134602-Pelagomonas_calceolata.AAC.3